MPKRFERRRGHAGPWSHRSATLASERAEHAVLAVIADTHSAPHERSAELVAAREPDAILHAGDIGDPEVLARFEAIAPVVVVRGNIDTRAGALPDSVDIRVVDARGDPLSILFLQHICVRGPKLLADAVRKAKAHDAQGVVCGHSHVPFVGRDRGLFVFNPGSIGPRRFTLPIVFGVMELTPGRVNMFHVSCETGTRWMPGMPRAVPAAR